MTARISDSTSVSSALAVRRAAWMCLMALVSCRSAWLGIDSEGLGPSGGIGWVTNWGQGEEEDDEEDESICEDGDRTSGCTASH